MTDNPRATVTSTPDAFHVEAYEKIAYSADLRQRRVRAREPRDRRQLPVRRPLSDGGRRGRVHELYGTQMRGYFDHHGIALTVFPVRIRETDKTLPTLERIVDGFGDFGLVRTEPVLVVGGGLTTDVTGLACAVFRRSHQLHPGTHHPHRADRRQRGDQGRGQPRQVQEPAGRLPRLEAGDPRLLVPQDAADRPGAQRDGRTDQDRGGREQRDLRVAGEVRRGPAAHPLRSRRRHPRAARHRAPRHLRRHPDHARPRGAQPPGARPGPRHRVRSHLESDPGTRSPIPPTSTVMRWPSTWPCRRPSRSAAATSRSATGTGSAGC